MTALRKWWQAQILAYANLPGTERVTLVLAYPCYPETWRQLHAQRRTTYTARIPAARTLRLVLAGVPFVPELLGEAAAEMQSAIERV